ncbi:E3 ubiquitin-protein ligase HERC2 (HECT domain and RCC1-like domain-containing protein 2) (HECT-type E3 ubiquitin transferase HERC2) [Durusdinium trenchii]|uniref:E3 ubiquitin-protein ligase HERC2 (HECT domain and RCC1-like domain-containing protein 2) (HECT-type E3 ubiquitin transferase HERC2) n=1 Tax=Durusdinium trenchii TaxID=1381693 RepID=A0ABP0HU29_9DINO
MARSFQNQKNYRKDLAEETLRILQRGGYSSPEEEWVDLNQDIEDAVQGSFVLHEGDPIRSSSPERASAPSRWSLEVTAETSLEALYRLAGEATQDAETSMVLLNFASAKNPGGGFLGGAQAQEESLARSSALFPCLDQFKDDLYAANRKDPRNGFYSDDMIFSPKVPFFRTDTGALLPRPVKCSVITAPAVNAGVVGGGSAQKVLKAMEVRLHRLLRLALAQNSSTLILGLEDPGRFSSYGKDVASLFDVALARPELSNFGKVVFAVPDPQMKEQFSQVLLSGRRRAAPSAAPPAAPVPVGPLPAEPPAVAEATVTSVVEDRLLEDASPEWAMEETTTTLPVRLVSFGYGRGGGIPAADLVFDARCIQNPQKGPLRHLSGLDARLRKEVMANDGAEELFHEILEQTMSRISREQPTTVAVGCTHGKHRSVTFCEELAKTLRGKSTPEGRRLKISIEHREEASWSKKGRWRGRQGRDSKFQRLQAVTKSFFQHVADGGWDKPLSGKLPPPNTVGALAGKRLILAGVDPTSPAGLWNAKQKVWGSSEHGQLGIGSLPTEDKAVAPRLVEGLRSVPVKQVASGGFFSAAVSESGELYTWGHGKDGQLGHGDLKDVHMPRAVRSLQSKVVRSVSCGEHHVGAVSEVGILYTWGRGQNGRLGHGGHENELLPKPVETMSGHAVGLVACGEFHTACILQSTPHVYSWGLGLSGRLGHGDEQDRQTPAFVEALTGMQVSTIACGGHHTAAVGDHWQVMTWGGGAFGKLGHGNRLAQSTPKVVVALQGQRVTQVSLGPHHSAALTQKGEVYTWGQAGRLGHASQGAEVDEMIPRPVAALSHVTVAQISCGHSHCCAVTESGDVWAWGNSRTFGHTEQSAYPNVPTIIKVLAGKAIISVACGVTHNVALSDYRRLTRRGALSASSIAGSGAAEPGGGVPRAVLPGPC